MKTAIDLIKFGGLAAVFVLTLSLAIVGPSRLFASENEPSNNARPSSTTSGTIVVDTVPAASSSLVHDVKDYTLKDVGSHSITWSNGGDTILTVSGLESDVIRPSSGSLVYAPQFYSRPTKAEDCKIELVTADGKKWLAKWEEVKP